MLSNRATVEFTGRHLTRTVFFVKAGKEYLLSLFNVGNKYYYEVIVKRVA